MVRLVLFDIDGTLIRTGGAGVRAFERVCASEFGIANAVERLNFAGRTDHSILREFFELYKIEHRPEHAERFFDRYAFWLDYFMRQLNGEVCPGARKFILDLERFPEPPLIGLLTGNIRLGAEIKLRHFSMWDFFRMGAFGDDHECRDELAGIARDRGCQMLSRQLSGEEILVIGDTPLDIRCARSIGARVLAVATGGATMDGLRPHSPDWLVEDLRQVCVDEVIGG